MTSQAPVTAGQADQSGGPDRTLHGRTLTAARVTWFVLALETTALVVLGLASRRMNLLVQPSLRPALHQIGLPAGLFALIAYIAPAVVFIGSGLVILYRQSRDWMAMIWSIGLIIGGATHSQTLFAAHIVHPWSRPLVEIDWLLTTTLVPIAMFLFPTGRFIPRWTRWLAIGFIPIYAFFPDLPKVVARFPESLHFVGPGRGRVIMAISSAYLLLAVYSQLRRFLSHSNAIERQQTKLTVITVSLFVVSIGGAYAMLALNLPATWVAWTLLFATPFSIVFPISVAVAVLRYRLYDIDHVLNRTLVYGSLTVSMIAIYGVAVIGFQAALGMIGYPTSDLAIAASTLLVAGLFRPALGHIQGFIDRRFYRTRYDAIRTVNDFSARLRNEVDLEALKGELMGAVRQTVDPIHVSLWLRPSEVVPAFESDVADRLL